MDKKQSLKTAAYEVFRKKVTRQQVFQKLLGKLVLQLVLFITITRVKKPFF